ncbi:MULTISPECIES: phosphatidate cytidylyltransferase [unclassified Gemella]|uniref:phosphatidate cytidylyltransferase n=1 Tax=unclassified Gemella TaxID=2624949 RepID=UPI001C03D8D3|nr:MULTISPECIES: phosphatidate cytidylyltransferase [unclassified Gemella]MBU0278284.1 phosphatidate cytidylyltransferase [Gemella sp. zg-1178]QWQ38209.1 phosphatidate cytidylyltransferase [Gemella sp. zg-570]
MKTRIQTAVVALILFVPFLVLGGNYFLFASLVLSFLSVYEIVKITFGKINIGVFILSSLFVLGFFFKKYFSNEILTLSLLIIIFLLFLNIIISNHKIKLVDIANVFFLSFYITLGFYSLNAIREISLSLLFYLLLTIWVTDSGAYFGGMRFGKRKLSSNISPNKSIEGSIIGSLLSIIVAIIFYLTTDIFSNILIAISVTIIISLIGQIGDLVESAYKREYNVKDSSNILPGHGGIFDRFDSLILSAPFLLILLELIK